MSDTARKQRYVIIGGGITGLSSAFYLQKQVREKGIHAEITLLEQSEELGGKIKTMHKEGYVIERGPDSFLGRKLPIIELSRELGLEDEFVGTNPLARTNYILHRNQLHRMPPGLVLGIPTQIKPFISTGLISYAGKARAALDLLLPRRESDSDESLGSFLQRRLGREVLENIAEPLLSGIYAGDTSRLSVKATFPQFPAVERKHRSIILGMLASKKHTQETTELPDLAKRSVFLTYRNGLITLVNALKAHLTDVRIRTGVGVSRIEREESGYILHCSDSEVIHADRVIVTLPAYRVPPLFQEATYLQPLTDMDYVSVANVVMAFDAKDVEHPLEGSGFVIPRKEGKYITACTWTSSKWLHTAPEGKILLRCYVGRYGDERWKQHSDEEIVQGALQDLKEIMQFTAKPNFYEVTRLHQSMPQYPVGHLDVIGSIRSKLAKTHPGILLAGSAYEGVGLPDCIRQGRAAAQQLAELQL